MQKNSYFSVYDDRNILKHSKIKKLLSAKKTPNVN